MVALSTVKSKLEQLNGDGVGSILLYSRLFTCGDELGNELIVFRQLGACLLMCLLLALAFLLLIPQSAFPYSGKR